MYIDRTIESAGHSFSCGWRSDKGKLIRFRAERLLLLRSILEISQSMIAMSDNHRYCFFEIAEDHAIAGVMASGFDFKRPSGVRTVTDSIWSDLSLRPEEQVSSPEEAVSSIEELTNTVKQNAAMQASRTGPRRQVNNSHATSVATWQQKRGLNIRYRPFDSKRIHFLRPFLYLDRTARPFPAGSIKTAFQPAIA